MDPTSPAPPPPPPQPPGTTPYERAKALHAEGLSIKEIREKLVAEGQDAETASLAASAVAGRAPMDINAFSADSFELKPALSADTIVNLELRWERGSFVDVAINLLGGFAVMVFGTAMIVGWSLGKNWSLLMFGLLLVSFFRFRWYEIGKSMLRIVLGIAVVASAFMFGKLSPVMGGFVAVLYGMFYAVSGWFAFRRFEHKKLGVPVPEVKDPAPPAEPPVPAP